MKFRLIATAATALALAACGTAEEETDVVVTEETAAPAEMGMAGAPADPSTPQGFVSSAAASDMFELESSRLAQTKSQNEGVLEFAQMMITDHTTSTRNLQQAAGEVEGVTVTPALTSAHQQQLTALRDASAAEFDALYKQQQVASHEMALGLMQTYGETGEAAPLQTFATSTAPVIERHLGMARDLP